jgi:segregation and condensation protein A
MATVATSQPGMRFRLRDFEGPLDLLLFLVSENELDIWNIPIVSITRQYQEWMNEIGEVDLDTAGDYILMSATLLSIKARLLLPQESTPVDDVEDPRRELALRLLDYQRLRELSQSLATLEAEGRELWPRRFVHLGDVVPGTRDDSLRSVSLYDLARCYAELVARPPRPTHHEVELFPFTVEDQVRRIRDRLSREALMPLSKLHEEPMDRPMNVISLLAVLDMVRNQELSARQTWGGGEIWLIDPARARDWLGQLRDLAE